MLHHLGSKKESYVHQSFKLPVQDEVAPVVVPNLSVDMLTAQWC